MLVSVEDSTRAMPKSMTLACPESSTMMFAGLMSRWMIFLEWAWCRASASWATSRAASFHSMGAPPAICSARVLPSMYSRAM